MLVHPKKMLGHPRSDFSTCSTHLTDMELQNYLLLLFYK